MRPKIGKGQIVRIKPQWQDVGDSSFVWVALEDEDDGKVRIQPLGTGLRFVPNYIVQTDWLEEGVS